VSRHNGLAGNPTSGVCEHQSGVLGEGKEEPHQEQGLRLRGGGGRGASVRGEPWRQHQPHHPVSRQPHDQKHMPLREMRGGADLRKASGGGAPAAPDGRLCGCLVAWHGGRAGDCGCAVWRLRVHWEAVPDVVSKC